MAIQKTSAVPEDDFFSVNPVSSLAVTRIVVPDFAVPDQNL